MTSQTKTTGIISCCRFCPVSTDCLGMPQNALGCLRRLMRRQLTSFATCFHIPHPEITFKHLVMGCASSHCACHLRLCSFRLTVLPTDSGKSTKPDASDVTCVECKTQACGCPNVENGARLDKDMQAVHDAGMLCNRQQIQLETTCRGT